jgi:hypothetical protein
MLRVNNFLHKPEAVRSYWLKKQASWECFRLFCSLYPCNNFTVTIIIIHKYLQYKIIINIDDGSLQDRRISLICKSKNYLST